MPDTASETSENGTVIQWRCYLSCEDSESLEDFEKAGRGRRGDPHLRNLSEPLRNHGKTGSGQSD